MDFFLLSLLSHIHSSVKSSFFCITFFRFSLSHPFHPPKPCTKWPWVTLDSSILTSLPLKWFHPVQSPDVIMDWSLMPVPRDTSPHWGRTGTPHSGIQGSPPPCWTSPSVLCPLVQSRVPNYLPLDSHLPQLPWRVTCDQLLGMGQLCHGLCHPLFCCPLNEHIQGIKSPPHWWCAP